MSGNENSNRCIRRVYSATWSQLGEMIQGSICKEIIIKNLNPQVISFMIKHYIHVIRFGTQQAFFHVLGQIDEQ